MEFIFKFLWSSLLSVFGRKMQFLTCIKLGKDPKPRQKSVLCHYQQEHSGYKDLRGTDTAQGGFGSPVADTWHHQFLGILVKATIQ